VWGQIEVKKLLLGVVVSILFIYLSLKDVDYQRVLMRLENLKSVFLVPAIGLLVSASFLRSLRLGVILSPLKKVNQKKLYPANCVGYMAMTLIPMRIGDLFRSYLVSARGQVPFSSVLATTLVERVLDSLTLLGILFFIILNFPLPPWMIRSGYFLLAGLIVLLFLIYSMYYRAWFAVRFSGVLVNRLPQKIRTMTEKAFRNFIEGLKIIASPWRFVSSLFLSLLIWGASGLAVYSLFFFQNLQLPVISAFTVLVITVIGISLPTAPGFLGNIQFACIIAFSFSHLPKSDALAFSLFYQLVMVGTAICLGLVFLPFIDVSLKDMKKRLDY
jgi:uncharacterized protein (TIRG00374 family)